jgi:hypothetical protein
MFRANSKVGAQNLLIARELPEPRQEPYHGACDGGDGDDDGRSDDDGDDALA